MNLDRFSSVELVNGLVRVIGVATTQKMLAVDDARAKVLCSGRGCLSQSQLERIDSRSGRAWQRWAVDAGGRHAKTVEDRAFVANAARMWDEILGPEKPKSRPRVRPHSPQSTATRPANRQSA